MHVIVQVAAGTRHTEVTPPRNPSVGGGGL